MPSKYLASFNATHTWKWDGAEPGSDAGMIAFAEAAQAGDRVYLQDFAVDRSRATPRLTWQYYELQWDPTAGIYIMAPTGDFSGVDLTDGTYYTPSGYNPNYGMDGPAPVASVGRWESDAYGRPFDLNDLVAGS